jgi:hypothetical protein
MEDSSQPLRLQDDPQKAWNACACSFTGCGIALIVFYFILGQAYKHSSLSACLQQPECVTGRCDTTAPSEPSDQSRIRCYSDSQCWYFAYAKMPFTDSRGEAVACVFNDWESCFKSEQLSNPLRGASGTTFPLRLFFISKLVPC